MSLRFCSPQPLTISLRLYEELEITVIREKTHSKKKRYVVTLQNIILKVFSTRDTPPVSR